MITACFGPVSGVYWRRSRISKLPANAESSAEALEVLKHSGVDIILLDFDLGSERGSEFISAAWKVGYQGRFLIVTGAPDARSSALALKAGASGIFLKSEARN